MNSSQLLAFSVRSAAAGAALWPAVVRIAGVDYPATVTEPAKVNGEFIPGAEHIDGLLVARVKKADLAVKPVAHQSLYWKRPGASSWDTIVWFIEEITGESPADAEWRISCVPKN